jgi:ubiquinone/menaquinone biosynthesis C-methylase UbiE
MSGADSEDVMMSESGMHVREIRSYWRDAHAEYLEAVGTTFQAGRLAGNCGDSARSSNERLALAAGIRPGEVLLDAGCGVCGPAIDIGRYIGPLRIVGVTLSPEQAATACELIAANGLAKAIQVAVGDYHALPFPDRHFDLVYFFESFGYSYHVDRLVGEVWRVLRPGGRVYIKDVFRSGARSAAADQELAEFDRVFAFRTQPPDLACAALARSGFVNIRSRDLNGEIRTDHVNRAMFHSGDRRLGLTRFGQRHFRVYWQLPVFFAEIQAVRP